MAKALLPGRVRRLALAGPSKTRRKFSHRRTVAHALRFCLVASCLGLVYSLLEVVWRLPYFVGFVAFCLFLRRIEKSKGSGWTHGTARMASFADLVRNRLLGNDGLILGSAGLTHSPSLWQALNGLFSPSTDSETASRQFFAVFRRGRWAMNRFIRLKEFVHLATFAPAGRGKSVCVLVPNLRAYSRSCVVTDPKGELFTLTGDHRRRKFRHRIIRLDPFSLCGAGSDSFNPLLFIDAAADDFLDQCRDLANMLILRTGQEKDPHWCDSAEIVLTAFIAYVCGCEDDAEKRTLYTVRELISSRHSYATAVEIMQKIESHFGVIQRQGHSLTWFVEKELASVLTTVQRCTQFLDSPVVARNTGSSSFDPRCLRSGRATIYLILPHDKLVTLAPLMRLWVGMILRTITRGVPDDQNRVLFLIDEAGHLGKIQVLEDAVTLMRGMGIRLWFFYQSITQLHICFGENASTILDNIETQQYFGINSYFAADEISKRIGDATISTTTRGDTTGYSRPSPDTGQQPGSVSGGISFNYADTGRRLLKPEELILLPDDLALIFHRNVPVIPALLLKYFEAEEFRNGGTGSQRGLGVMAGLVAVACLLASGFVASLAANLSTPQQRPVRHMPARPPSYWRFEDEPPRRFDPRPTEPDMKDFGL
jgi:type IV secretion system protein VirD4